MEPNGRVFIVTGASSGLGAALAHLLVEGGARVALAARRENALQAVADAIGAPDRTLVQPTDVTLHADLERLVQATLARFEALHGVIHCAGIGVAAHLEHTSPGAVEDLVRINLLAPMWLTRLALPALRREPESVVVLVSSMSALVGPPLQAAYVASKRGLGAFGEVLARDLDGSGVHVVTVYPGILDTPMIADLRLAQARVGFESPAPVQAASDAAAEVLQAVRRAPGTAILGGWQNRIAALLARRARWFLDARLRRLRPNFERLAAAEAEIRAEREAITRR